MACGSAREAGFHRSIIPPTACQLSFTDRSRYQDHTVDVQAAAVDQKFTDRMAGLIRRVATDTPAARVPSSAECRFCDITGADCPERTDDEDAAEGDTVDF